MNPGQDMADGFVIRTYGSKPPRKGVVNRGKPKNRPATDPTHANIAAARRTADMIVVLAAGGRVQHGSAVIKANGTGWVVRSEYDGTMQNCGFIKPAEVTRHGLVDWVELLTLAGDLVADTTEKHLRLTSS